ncbi:MAG: HK97 gp10 family phage protein [Phycisphaerales bacterium]|nr:HK97 gp10 family phage protein [Phycisphaerales bacterium]
MANRVVDVISIDGTKHLKRVFEELPGRIGTKIARRALYAAALPIRDAARAGVPVRYGALKRSIIVKTGQQLVDAGGGKKIRGGDLKVYITIDSRAQVLALKRTVKKFMVKGPHGTKARFQEATWSIVARNAGRGGLEVGKVDPRHYAHLVEFGTRPHAVGKDSELATRVNSSRKGSGVQLGKQHPGARAKPFMRPAFDSQSNKADGIIGAKVGELLTEEAAKLARLQPPRRGGKGS